MFHAQDGLFFQRMENGTVEVMVKDGNRIFQTVLTSDTWASVIASVSARGDTSFVWEEAIQFHNEGGHSVSSDTDAGQNEVSEPQPPTQP